MRWIPFLFIMKLLKKIKNWFDLNIKENKPKDIKTTLTLDVFDDVWVSKDNQIYNGWVYEKNKNNIFVIYNGLEEIKFYYNKTEPQTIIQNGNNKLILNKYDI